MNNITDEKNLIDRYVQIYKGLNSEGKGNTVVYLFIVADTIISIISSCLAFAGVFKVNEVPFHISGIMFILSAIVFGILIHRTDGRILLDRRFKYYMLVVILICVGIQCSMLYFHTTIALLVPFLLAFCYKSLEFELIIALFTGLLIIATPYIAFYFGGMDSSFPMWYISITEPELFQQYHGTLFDNYEYFLDIHPAIGLFLWVVLPRLLLASSMIFIMMCSNRIQRKSYERRIGQIKFMQDITLEGLADVIESRDVETGGHVKRTQQVVEILTSKLKESYEFPDKYWSNVIKAAPMHDLGKIYISDTILNKPDKLTDEEFGLIKLHPEKSVEIIERILDKVEDESFVRVAKNIALYHHEKYDGHGYPKGIMNEEIPLEARIMAIADVFDALVSKRVYKKAYSVEKAREIIIESMGTHFDPVLLPAFEASFPELVSLYR